MTYRGTPNGGLTSPGSTRTEPRPRCCTACIRGTREIQGPCGYALNCPKGCHTRSAQSRAVHELILLTGMIRTTDDDTQNGTNDE